MSERVEGFDTQYGQDARTLIKQQAEEIKGLKRVLEAIKHKLSNMPEKSHESCKEWNSFTGQNDFVEFDYYSMYVIERYFAEMRSILKDGVF